MGIYRLNVPTVAQEKDWSCWHASSEMIWLYSQGRTGRVGPMFTLVKEWTDDKGLAINVDDFVRLATTVGMKAARRLAQYSSNDLINMLMRLGPLWCAGKWYGFGHVIVLTGISGETVYINDPDGGVRKTGSVGWFNQKLLKSIDGCLMYKDPRVY